MQLKIELQECLKDSPKFRNYLENEETNIDQLETKLDKVLKQCGLVIDSGKSYVAQNSLFANSLWDLTMHFKEDSTLLTSLNKLIHALQEMNKFHTILLDQASRTVLKNLTSFVKNDIKEVKEHKHHFDKISTELDSVMVKNSQLQKSKSSNEMEEMDNMLLATKSCFSHTALDYVYKLHMVQCKKKREILATLLSYMQAYSTYFHQGSDLCEDLESFFKEIASQVDKYESLHKSVEKDLENRHSMVKQTENGDKLEGYLFKRTSNAFKTWNRRWFYLVDNQLVYRKRSEDTLNVMENDIRVCSVKSWSDAERRFCFEVLSPTKSHILQAESQEMYDKWVTTLQQRIGKAIQQSFSNNTADDASLPTSSHLNHNQKVKIWEQLLRIPGNNYCCDCKIENPKWASINLGITLCIECSGVHRSLGVHNSKVRSLTLDDWEPEVVKVMAELGNKVVNRIYEAELPQDVVRPTPKCDNSIREAYIKSKYIDRQFVRCSFPSSARKWSVRKLRKRIKPSTANVINLETNKEASDEESINEEEEEEKKSHVLVFGDDLEKVVDILDLSSDQDSTGGDDQQSFDDEQIDISDFEPNLLLYKAAKVHNVAAMSEALALGADKNFHNDAEHAWTPLHQAVFSGSVMSCTYLLLNGANINAQDTEGRTALYWAAQLGHTAQVCLLLKHNADQHIADEKNQQPLNIAVAKADADIVTLLRLGRLNEQMKDADVGVGDDVTFNDVVRDFSLRLNRNK